ncbi:MAG: FAD-binding oxidoreductase [Beijerinckiaceae bacterium]|nr:FAD-binding oxidoreductase [Beijerinckiaceae bacterium]
MRLSGWGRFPVADCNVLRPRTQSDLLAALAKTTANAPAIARGLGRSYGDSALNTHATVSMTAFAHMLSFDAQRGLLVAESGVTLADVISVFLPRGWFVSVTPGTKFVTLGGAIAADVHGKNHHKDGSFGGCVEWIDVVGRDGVIRRCSRAENADLFAWTLGGMGLTGVILRAAIRLRRVESGWLRQRSIPAPNLAAAMSAFEDNAESTYSVAWIDCLASGANLGRSIVLLGEHALADELDVARRPAPFVTPARRALITPFDAPGWALNQWTVGAFNALYWLKGSRGGRETLVDWDSYFYPLDSIHQWNRIYGKRGFAQFQCVLPLAASRTGLEELLAVISASGHGSFLAVLKRMGAQDSRFSFPMEGYTLALDFPAHPKALALMERLDAITLAHGGRFYLAKDSRLSRAIFEMSDPRVADFRAMRSEHGLDQTFTSIQSERLGL